MCRRARRRRLVGDVEFFALLIWLLLGGLATAVAPLGLTNPSAGITALAAFGGAGACILFIALGAPVWAGWVQVGMAMLGIVAGTFAVAWLSDDALITGSEFEGLAAGALGVALPFFGAAAFVTLLIALQVTDPVV
jgi:hypothetical protein